MAETLQPTGIVIPNADGEENISRVGVAELRATGVTTSAAIMENAFNQGRVPNGSDIFTLASGSWTVSSTGNAATMINLPEEWPMRLLVQGGEAIVNTITAYPYSRDYTWETSRSALGGWLPWRKIDGAGLAPYAQHTIRQTQMLTAMGGPIDTGGLGAVAWRIDHGFKNFRDIMLPIFRAAGIVPMITYNPRDWSRPENEGVTASDLNQWVADGWVEISNHGTTHSNATGADGIHDFVVNGLAEIEAELPAARGKVFGFCIPGVGVTDAYDGFAGGSKPEQWGTYTGKLILENHAVGYGYLEGTALRVLDGTPRDGLLHMGTDTRAVSEFTTAIDDAIAQRKGLQIMSHPSNLGTSGYHSAATIQAIVDHIVAKRDAGELAVLSPYQMMVADSTKAPAEASAWSDVTGKPSTFPPAAHTHAVTDVTGLAARLAAIEQDTGDRNITRLVPGVSAGHWTVRRIGKWVYMNLYDLTLTATAGDYWQVTGFLPVGLRPPAASQYVQFPTSLRSSAFTPGPFRVDRYGGVTVYGVTGKQVAITASWVTNDAFPTTPIGDPA